MPSSPRTTEQRVDHLTDAVGDLSQQQRDLRLAIRELRSDVSDVHESVLQVRETQREHGARLGHIETVLVEILSRLPERPADPQA